MFRNGHPPIVFKRKAITVDIILNQQYSYKQAEILTDLSIYTIARPVRTVHAENILFIPGNFFR